MANDDPAVPAQVASAYARLKGAAADLNAESNALGHTIAALDEALQRLNLGIEGWVTFGNYEEPHSGDTLLHELGYARVGLRWGIALRVREGNVRTQEETSEAWLFNEGPRSLRVDAVEKLPDLLVKLAQEADATAARIRSKTEYAKQVMRGVPHAFVPAKQPVSPRGKK